eukprot:748205-Rhodomonas_salina.3
MLHTNVRGGDESHASAASTNTTSASEVTAAGTQHRRLPRCDGQQRRGSSVAEKSHVQGVAAQLCNYLSSKVTARVSVTVDGCSNQSSHTAPSRRNSRRIHTQGAVGGGWGLGIPK